MGAENADAVAITDDGTAGGHVHALVTRHDLAPLFGANPATLLREVRGASSTGELCALNHRARAFVLEQLTSAASADWLARFTHVVSRYDRQALKSGFPVIQRLLEFTANLTWRTAL
jgi:hypothetical protein